MYGKRSSLYLTHIRTQQKLGLAPFLCLIYIVKHPGQRVIFQLGVSWDMITTDSLHDDFIIELLAT